jgi:carboxypeptidase C (cathepsin A)
MRYRSSPSPPFFTRNRPPAKLKSTKFDSAFPQLKKFVDGDPPFSVWSARISLEQLFPAHRRHLLLKERSVKPLCCKRWKRIHRGACLTVLLTSLLAKPARSQETPVITQQRVQVGGRLLRYTAEVGRVAICDVETGEPHGYMFYTAYRLPSAPGPRPITFVWNGGPGADSSLLHFSVVGPKLARDGHLIDNTDTWLPATDLVLVDPIGTGFSRPVKSEYAAEFYSTLGDVASVTEFVRAWRLLHAAEGTPLFLAGESWGAGRAAHVAYSLEKRGISVNGLVLISGGWGLNKEYISPELHSALQIVDMATTALYYNKTAPPLGKTNDEIRRAAENWARETYAPALARLDKLSDDDRTSIIAQLSRFTGLSQESIDRKTLTLSPRQFRTELLKNEHKEPYIFDMRRTSPPEDRDSAAILQYLRHELGYRTSLPYIGLEAMEQGFAPTGTYSEPVNARWNYATASITPDELKAAIEEAARRGEGPPRLGPPLPGTEEALALNPRMHVLVAAGMYDSFLPCAVGAEIAKQLPSNLRPSITFKCYVGGHAMYKDGPARAEFSRDVNTLIQSSK